MLLLKTRDQLLHNEETDEIYHVKGTTLKLEFSLISISKWERKTHKKFFSEEPMTRNETIEFIRCMTLNEVDPLTYLTITDADIAIVQKYMDDPMTATTFSNVDKSSDRGEGITSELIYYWMVAFNIPFEAQKWHLNRLLTLVRVCNIKNSPAKKMSKNETIRHHRRVNAARRKKKVK